MTVSQTGAPSRYQRAAHHDRPTQRRRHTAIAALVGAYLLAAVVAVAAHGLGYAPGWLALHLTLLGAASNAVFFYSRHFAQALLHTGDHGARWAYLRLAGLNLGAVAVLTGVCIHLPWLAGSGAGLVIAAVLAHTASLVAMARGAAMSGRLRVVVWYYTSAGVALVVGGALGGVLASATVRSPAWQLVLRDAHAHVNLLGWLGLALLGTQFMLWPAVLRTGLDPAAPRVARRVLAVVAVGLAVAVAALLAGERFPATHWVAAAGMATYAAGAGYALRPAITAMRPAPPRGLPAVALLAGICWLLVALVADITALCLGIPAADRMLDRLLPVLGIGVIAQVLIGVLTFLLPVTVGDATTRARLTGIVGYAWLPRTLLGNLGLPLITLPVPGGVRALGWTLVLTGFAPFPLLLAVALATAYRPAGAAAGRRVKRLAGYEVLALGCVLAVVALLGLVATGTWPAHRHTGGAAAVSATSGVPVAVTLSEFTITPASIAVAPGTDLVLAVRNIGMQSHDLRLAGGRGTGMLAPGQRQSIDLGVVTRDEVAWCTVPGHREDGMRLDIHVVTGPANTSGRPTPSPAGMAGADGMAGMDGMAGTDGMNGMGNGPASPAPTWHAYDPTLAPAPGGTEHEVTLRVQHTTAEIAPGVRQRVWTYNGTVPGPILHGHVGDLFTVRLVNEADLPHSIDFHASEVNPAVAMRPVPPGGTLTYQFRAEHAGIWLYHCASAPMIQHLAMGMYGAVVIDPPTLGPVTTSLVLVQSEFYLAGGGIPGLRQLVTADPDLVVFNGYANQYRYAPVHVRAGTRVRLWMLDAGPNQPSALHVVGTQFDTVFKEGGYQVTPGNPAHGAAQALDLQPGQGGFVEFTLTQPGTYTITTHRLSDAERGALGTLIADP